MSHTIFGREYSESFDAIVIGSGVGGLVCANYLADGGMKVLLLERHYMLGGFCSTFRRRGYVFDAATHFYPLLGNPTTITGKMLKKLGVETEWVKMDPVDRFHFPSMPAFAVPAEFDQYVSKLKDWFPEQVEAIDAYFAHLRQAYLHGLLYYFRGVDNERARELERFTISEKLDEFFADERLKALLMADCAHWGSLPERTSFLFDAMLRLSYFLGNYYPVGGSQQFANDLAKALESRGGKVLRCGEVEEILVENGRARGVRIRTISKRPPERFEFRSKVVVSNADSVHTFADLLPGAPRADEYAKRLKSLVPTYPCALVHLGLEGMDPARLEAAEGYYWNSFDQADVIRDVFKIFVPTRFDTSVAPPGCQILIVQKLVPVSFDEIEDWSAHKQQVERDIMDRLRKILPDIDDRIVIKLSASAMTSYRYTRNWHGAMLGWEMSPEQLGAARLPTETPVKNLHLVGHWTRPGGGITPVMVSAKQVAEEILSGRRTDEDRSSWL